MKAISLFAFLLLQPAKPLVVPAGTIVSARLQSTVKTASSNSGDTVIAILTESIRAEGKVAVPEGSQLNGRIETMSPATSTSEGHVRLVFREIVLPDGRTLPTWVTQSFAARPPKRTLRYVLYTGIGTAAGALAGGSKARITGIIGGALGGFILASNSQGEKLPEVVVKRGRIVRLRLGEDLQLE
jgi:hypothetical protein